MKFKEALIAYLQGDEVEVFINNGWRSFGSHFKYQSLEDLTSDKVEGRFKLRIKPSTVFVNEEEVPSPETTAPAYGTHYYYPCFDAALGIVGGLTWTGDKTDDFLFKNGLVYLNADDCELRAKAMLRTS